MIPRAATFLLLATLFLAACGGDDEPTSTEPAPTESPAGIASPNAQTQPAVVYLLRDEKVAPVARRVPRTTGVAGAALRALFEGVTAEEEAQGLSTAVPEGTRLLGIDLDAGTATVDLSAEFESGGGSASMLARVAQVVHTVTRFPAIQRVAFRIDGEPVEAIGGEGVVVDPPVDRADFEEQAPAILVESPLPGARVRSPLRVSGTSNTFEATSQLELLDGDGNVLRKRFVTATSGTGTRGTWKARLRFDAPAGTALELYTYESSAEDGSPLHEVRIPLVAR